jgi:molybdate transport system substrate-binding protein
LERLALAFAALLLACSAHAQTTLVFAAASLKNALDEAAQAYRAGKVVVSYGASSTLAKQIQNGAPAEVFISADLDWMDYLDRQGLLAPGTRRNLLRNGLVLVAAADRPVKLAPAPGFALRRALGSGRLALADPSSVPAGKYARAALEKLGVWGDVAGRLAPADNVRAALAFVARGEAPLGIVYATDAREEPRVVVAGVFPDDTHPPIVYPAAALRGARSGARQLLGFLSGREAGAIFEKHGFALH